MKKNLKSVISVLLALLLVFTALPMSAFALDGIDVDADYESMDNCVNHEWSTEKIEIPKSRKEATCAATGSYVKAYQCTVCQAFDESSRETVTLPIDADAHPTDAVENRDKVDATCTEYGNEAGTYCTACKTWVTGGDVIPAKNHAWSAWAIDEDTWNVVTDSQVEANNSATVSVKRTCDNDPINHVETDAATVTVTEFKAITDTEDGYVKFTATYEDTQVGEKTVEFHSWSDWSIAFDDSSFVENPEATDGNTIEATASRVCGNNAEHKEEAKLTVGNGISIVDFKASTKKENGSITFKATYAGKEETITKELSKIACTSHEYTAEKVEIPGTRTDATCVAAGSYDVAYQCTLCDEFDMTSKETKEIPVDANAHPTDAVENREKVDATCTEAGHEAGTYCTACNSWVTGGDVIPAKGHVWKDGKCTVEGCGFEDVYKGYEVNCDNKYYLVGEKWNSNLSLKVSYEQHDEKFKFGPNDVTVKNFSTKEFTKNMNNVSFDYNGKTYKIPETFECYTARAYACEKDDYEKTLNKVAGYNYNTSRDTNNADRKYTITKINSGSASYIVRLALRDYSVEYSKEAQKYFNFSFTPANNYGWNMFTLTAKAKNNNYIYGNNMYVLLKGYGPNGYHEMKIYLQPSKLPKETLKVKAKKKALKLNYTKLSCASGYQVQYSLKKNMKKSTYKYYAGNKPTVKKLKGKKKYYVRVRAYKVVYVDGVKKTVYGAWSAKKAVKTK